MATEIVMADFINIMDSDTLSSLHRKLRLRFHEIFDFLQIQVKCHFLGMPLLLLGQFVLHLVMLGRLVHISPAIRNILTFLSTIPFSF
jgi:hypothetical protein